ncbi:MAG: hypothetical protein NG784_14525 [Candidatus Jettenia sp.]|nr:hypothetical protein [Candidatus Jettenia sp.]
MDGKIRMYRLCQRTDTLSCLSGSRILYSNFGYAFKQVVASSGARNAMIVSLSGSASIPTSSRSRLPEDAKMLHLYPKVPHPFVIEPLIAEKQSFASVEKFPFPVILIGQMWYLQKMNLSRKYKK